MVGFPHRTKNGLSCDMWRLWAKALGEKASNDDREADRIAWIRTAIIACYIVTNMVIVAGVVRHW